MQDDNPTSTALLRKTKPDAPAAAAAPLVAESMQHEDVLAFVRREEERIERGKQEARCRKKKAQPTVRPLAVSMVVNERIID